MRAYSHFDFYDVVGASGDFCYTGHSEYWRVTDGSCSCLTYQSGWFGVLASARFNDLVLLSIALIASAAGICAQFIPNIQKLVGSSGSDLS